MKRSHAGVRGFTLIELLIAFAVFAVLMIAVLQLLDSSTRISKTESNLSDIQESVRFTTYHLLRLGRMAGVASGTDDLASTTDQSLPSYLDNGGVLVPLAAHVLNNVSSFTDLLGTSHATLPNQDVLLLRGYFENGPYFIDRAGASLVSPVLVSGVTGGGLSQALRLPSANQGLLLMGQGRYAVANITSASIAAGSPDVLTVNFDDSGGAGAGAVWLSVNQNATYNVPAHVYRVAFLETYMFFVDPNNVLQRWRMSSNSVEPVSTDIGGLQVALGLDQDRDGALDQWIFDTPGETLPSNATLAASLVVALRMTVFGRTHAEVVGWTEPTATFNLEDMVAPTGAAAHAKWRVMQVVATLRNYSL